MSLIGYKRGQGGIVLRVKLLNSSVTTGAGLLGLTSASANLRIAAIADNEAVTVAYTGANIETITTLGTYAAPTAGKCRFKEVDATNHKGVYEIQLADARFAVAAAKSLLVSIAGATSLAETDLEIPLRDLDPYNIDIGGYVTHPFWGNHRLRAMLTYGVPSTETIDKTGRSLSIASRDELMNAIHNEQLGLHTTAGSHGKAVADAASAANKFQFDGDNYVRGNAKKLNDTVVLGNGTTGNKWRGS